MGMALNLEKCSRVMQLPILYGFCLTKIVFLLYIADTYQFDLTALRVETTCSSSSSAALHPTSAGAGKVPCYPRQANFFPALSVLQMLVVQTHNIHQNLYAKAGSLQKIAFPLAKEIFLIESCLEVITSTALLKVATK